MPARLGHVGSLAGAALAAAQQIGRLRHLDDLDVIGVLPAAAPTLAVGDERRAAGRQMAERPAAERDGALGVAALHGDLRGRPGELLHHEPAVEAHARALDALTEPGQQLECRLVRHLGADVLEDRHRLGADGVERVLGQDRERRLEHCADSV